MHDQPHCEKCATAIKEEEADSDSEDIINCSQCGDPIAEAQYQLLNGAPHCNSCATTVVSSLSTRLPPSYTLPLPVWGSL